MRTLLFFLLAFFLVNAASAQKFLQLERVNSPKTRKYFPGHEITFQMIGGQWYTRVIEDISYEQNLLLFPKDHVALDSIIAMRSFKPQKWSRPLGNQFFNFAAVWLLYSVVDEALQDQPFQQVNKSTYLIPATSAGTGFLIKKLFKQRTFRFEKNSRGEAKKWRLRVLDLDVKGELKKP